VHLQLSKVSLKFNVADLQKNEVRMEAELMDKSFRPTDCPLLMTVSQGKHVTSWDLPHTFQQSESTR